MPLVIASHLNSHADYITEKGGQWLARLRHVADSIRVYDIRHLRRELLKDITGCSQLLLVYGRQPRAVPVRLLLTKEKAHYAYGVLMGNLL